MSSNNNTFKPMGGDFTPKKETRTPISRSLDAFQKAAREAKGKEFPKINTIGDDVPYKHQDPMFGFSLGMTDEECGIMAAKFDTAGKKAKEKQRLEGGNLISRIVEEVVPTLTHKELCFSVGVVVKEKQQMQAKLGDPNEMLKILKQLGLDPESLGL